MDVDVCVCVYTCVRVSVCLCVWSLSSSRVYVSVPLDAQCDLGSLSKQSRQIGLNMDVCERTRQGNWEFRRLALKT